jgi:hypothetical protein
MKTLPIFFIVASFTAFGQSEKEELFPPIDIKSWNKTPCVSERLATEEETSNGTALLYYGKGDHPEAKPYPMKLPKLAYNTFGGKEELVVVIQIVQLATDTMVGYRPLTGSNGASKFRDFRFLSKKEVKQVTRK